MRRFVFDIYYSFPVQLLLVHIRSHLLLLSIWGLLLLFITGTLGTEFGIKYLFLSPEYMGRVGFWSFFFTGFSFGALAMSWNLTMYLLEAHHFPFLASLQRPFTKFCLNNFILPVTFLGVYLYGFLEFANPYETGSIQVLLWQIVGFLVGILGLLGIISLYLALTNKDIKSYLLKLPAGPPDQASSGPVRKLRRGVDVQSIAQGKTFWRVDTYLTETLRPRLVRSVAHYDFTVLNKVFRQNHTNAMIFQLITLLILVSLGNWIDKPSFRIPAAGSIFLLSSIVMAVIGAIIYWFHRWWIPVVITLIFGINILTSYEAFNHKNKAYGLNYKTSKAAYTYENLEALCSPEKVTVDSLHTIEILNNWLEAEQRKGNARPKMILFATSGGGLKSALWSTQVLRHLDSVTNTRFFDQVVLVSGSSGGLIGASYYRELRLQRLLGKPIDLMDAKYTDVISKDLLNAVAFSIVTNDLFLPWIPFEKGGYTYVKDRGYAWENQLNENTDFVFDKPLRDYQRLEYDAHIPMMFVTPSIVNDGRRMVISPQPISYMMVPSVDARNNSNLFVDAVDFGALLKDQDAQNLYLSNALRMNATYPYIMPNVFLPTDPMIEVMDAGFRDNFGLKSTIRFLSVFQDWIKNNTSGVVLVQVRGYDRDTEIAPSDNQGAIESIFNPLNIAGLVLKLQDYEHDTNLGFIYDAFGPGMFDIIRFTYLPSKKNKEAPISFHLTSAEKVDILNAIHNKDNRSEMQRLVKALNPKGQQ